MTPELRAYVAASRAEQGLPPTIQDPAALERIAAVFRLVNPQTAPVRRSRRRTAEAAP